MAFTYKIGERVRITRGTFKNQVGTVQPVGKSKIVILDKNQTAIYGVDDNSVERV